MMDEVHVSNVKMFYHSLFHFMLSGVAVSLSLTEAALALCAHKEGL
jgi:hypothetical protein